MSDLELHKVADRIWVIAESLKTRSDEFDTLAYDLKAISTELHQMAEPNGDMRERIEQLGKEFLASIELDFEGSDKLTKLLKELVTKKIHKFGELVAFRLQALEKQNKKLMEFKKKVEEKDGPIVKTMPYALERKEWWVVVEFKNGATIRESRCGQEDAERFAAKIREALSASKPDTPNS